MSSDEGGETSPVLPKDSDPGSSVSSELQEEYEDLLRFAVVTPKFEGHTRAHLQSRLSTSREAKPLHAMDDGKSQRQAGVKRDVADDRRSRGGVRTSSAQILDTHSQSRVSYVEERTGQSSSGTSGGPSIRSQAEAERSRQTSPDSWESGGTELFISEENISKIEDILDTWSNNLKSNVLTELRRWRLSLVEQHKQELRKEKERCAVRASGLSSELRSLKELLKTYETSNQRKDEVIVNLSKALDRQKEKQEAMRAFSTWRVQHSLAREEAHASKVAQQHYQLQLKRRVFLGWHGLQRTHWKEQVERACRGRAQEVCERLSSDYEAQIAQHCEAVEDAQAQIQNLRAEREIYEESMKKAFMRGVCALNMEAMTMFQPTGEGRPPPPPPATTSTSTSTATTTAAHHHHLHHHHSAPPPQDQRGCSSLAQPQERPVSSTRFSPAHFEPPSAPPAHGEAGLMLGSSAPVSRPEAAASAPLIHSSLPLGTPGPHRQASGGRAVTAVVGQQKAAKTVTARISARPDFSRVGPTSLHVMTMTPPMTSVVVERHQPITQVTRRTMTSVMVERHQSVIQMNVGQSGAHPGHSLPAATGLSSSSRAPPSTCHAHAIKVVD